jgi:hypothetical protein
MKALALLPLVLFTGMVHAAQSQAGFVIIDPTGTGRVSFPRSKPLTTSIFVQWLDGHDQIQCCIKLNHNDLKKIDAKSIINPQSDNTITNLRDDSEPGFIAYEIKSKLPPIDSGIFVGMAIAADKVISHSPYRLQAETDHKTLTARICFGEEGKT